MIETKDISLESFISKIITKNDRTDEQTLISWTEKLNKVNLLSVFQNALQTNKQRLYWKNSANTFEFVGIGSVHTIIAEDVMYDMLKKEWQQLLEKSIIHDPFQHPGTGLTAIGGMTFDPLIKQTKLWENFPESQLTIPELFIVRSNHDYFITVNKYVSNKSQIDKVIKEIELLKSTVFHSDNSKVTQHKINYKLEIEPEQWKRTVQYAVDTIKQGHARKIVLAREMKLTLNREANIASLLEKLNNTQENSYVFAFENGDDCFIGATPERLVQINGDKLLSTCLAGTAPRGRKVEEDEKIGQTLLNDEKNREEHDYVVKMIHEGITHYCEDIHIPKEPILYPLKNLQHLYTPVSATLKSTNSVFDIIQSLHPTPALGGVPKEKSLAFIREHEQLDRGWYGAPIGWLDSNDNSEFVVAIRSGLIKGKDVSLFAGCGVMKDSDPQMEYEETNIKFLPMLRVLEDHDE